MKREFDKRKPEQFERNGPPKATSEQPSANAKGRHRHRQLRVLLALSFFVALSSTVESMLGLRQTGTQTPNPPISASAAANLDIGEEIAGNRNLTSHPTKTRADTPSGSRYEDGHTEMVDAEDSNQNAKNCGYDMEFYIDNYYHEYEQRNTEPIVKGRLKAAIDFWKGINTNPVVLEIINKGYKLPFISKPGPKVHKNNKSALDHSGFVVEAITDLLNNGIIQQCHGTPDFPYKNRARNA